MGQPILRDRETPFEKRACALLSKGNPVNIPEPGGGCNGNVNELGDISGSPGKSFLFFLTAYHPESRLPGEGVQWLEKHRRLVVSGALPMILENPRERSFHPWSYS
jgi:hypothetical protein